jgi:hypothetical protein
VAQAVGPESKIVYVDNDALVITHARVSPAPTSLAPAGTRGR